MTDGKTDDRVAAAAKDLRDYCVDLEWTRSTTYQR